MRKHLEALLAGENDILARLNAHIDKLSGHHESRERDRAVRQARTSIRRHDRMRRRFERALAVQR